MDISSTNPLSPSPLYRDGVAARQRELPQTEGIESAGQQAVEAASARDAQLQAATQQVASTPENAAPQLNNRATELQSSLQAQLISRQAQRAQQEQQQATSVVTPASTLPPSPPASAAANPATPPAAPGDRSTGSSPQADISAPPPDATAQQTAAPRSTPQAVTRPEDSSRAELNASAQQQAVAQYQASQSLLQSSGGSRLSFSI